MVFNLSPSTILTIIGIAISRLKSHASYLGEITILSLISSLFALSAKSQTGHLRFEHFTNNDGLSHNNVICVLQDQQGFIWLGTRDGLNRFDGYNFKVFRNEPSDPKSINGNFINSIVEDKLGNIWVATASNGLSKFNKYKEDFEQYHAGTGQNDLTSNRIISLAVDSSNRVWIGTEDAGICIFDQKQNKFSNFNPIKNLYPAKNRYIQTIMCDNKNRIWMSIFGEGLGCYDINSGQFKLYTHSAADKKSISSNNIFSLFQDKKGNIWVGMDKSAINRFNEELNDFVKYDYKPPVNTIIATSIYSIGQDSNGYMWFGTENGGLSIYNHNTGKFVNYIYDEINETSLSNNSVYTTYCDRKGNMWVGTFSGGVNFYNKSYSNFVHYKHSLSENSLTHNTVLCFEEDRNKNIWIGTDGGGADLFNPKTGNFTHFKYDPKRPTSGISGNYVLCIMEDHEGKVWFGTWGDGITVYDPRTKKFNYFKNDPSNTKSVGGNYVWTIFEDKEHNIWIGTHGEGLDKYDAKAKTFKHYRPDKTNPNSIGTLIIHAIVEDENGNFWIGTDGGGINYFDKKTEVFTKYEHTQKKNSISDNSVNSLLLDSLGNLWVTTLNGLNYFNTKTKEFKAYTTKEGLPNNVTYGIIEDEKNFLWISTNKGISRYDLKTGTIKNYRKSDGLQSDEFKESAYLRTSDGTIFFGGINGFTAFHPQLLRLYNYEPQIVLTNFEIFNKEVPVSSSKNETPLLLAINSIDHLKIPYESNVISFEFASLDYSSTNNKQYAYKLSGFDKVWNYIGTERKITYTKLDPGVYTLEIKGTNNNGNWSTNVKKIVIEIVPPFWLTWWFKLLIASAVIGASLGLYAWRIESIQTQKETLAQQVQERTYQLGVSMEEEKRSRHEAEQANKAKSIFLATMSHEIRTPLNGIIGMSSLLSQTKLSTEQQGYTSTIQSCGESLLGVINDILDFSKIESGKMELEKKEFHLRTAIEEVLDIFATKAAQSGIDLIYFIDADVPEFLIGDVVRIKQILINLVGNAVKFTEKGEVFINITKLGDSKDLAILFEVKDTGIGIPEEKMNRLFKAFSQVDSSTTRKYGGTGLGLVICEKLVQMMGGEINARSTVGKGSTFQFSILTTEGVSKALPNALDHTIIEHKKVLVIDDNSTNRTILQFQLKQWNMESKEAAHGEDALKILEAGYRPDIVITDMHMPKMDGVMLAEQIKKNYPDIPVMLLSSIGNESDKSIQHLFDSILSKPVKQYLLKQQLVALFHKDVEVIEPEVETVPLASLSEQFPLQILIAEDNPINQQLALIVLTKQGYDPEIANNGLEAVEMMQAKAYDLIFMDVQMPEMDGLEATQKIRTLQIQQPIIIAMTANAMQGDRDICLNAGMDDYVSKPVKPEEIAAQIKKWGAQVSAKAAG